MNYDFEALYAEYTPPDLRPSFKADIEVLQTVLDETELTYQNLPEVEASYATLIAKLENVVAREKQYRYFKPQMDILLEDCVKTMSEITPANDYLQVTQQVDAVINWVLEHAPYVEISSKYIDLPVTLEDIDEKKQFVRNLIM